MEGSAATEYDVVVIGSGPAGEGAAMQCAKAGRRTAMVERLPQVGGACTHSGTIPSKALRQSVQDLISFKRNPLFRSALDNLHTPLPELLRSAAAVIQSQVRMRQDFYERNHVDIIAGQARFAEAGVLSVVTAAGERLLHARNFFVATGSRPYRPADIDFSHPRICDSDSILNLSETPQSLTVYGAGVIGCEYASIFRGLGVKLNLINMREKLLAFLDDEIVDALAYHLREQGVLIRHNEEYERVEGRDDGVILHLKSGKKLKSDYLLWANGRTGNSDGLGLEELGIAPDRRGNIPVNEFYQSSCSHIYAIGDVAGPPALASASYDQGRYAAAHLCQGRAAALKLHEAPAGIYTNPEISCIGKTERELTLAGAPYEVGHAFFRSLARAQIAGTTAGMLKLLFHRESGEILGIHCFGYQAAEIIHIGQAIMSQAAPVNDVHYFVNTTFNYPTMAEAYRVAALNGLNRLF
ncbi:MAG: Si-specific NAD(P)(+) transhydrogenase [Leptospirales bacterium]|nr:Si-specific NAD(P)(+) transhydrogenase [Leptospirales bacterium]